MLTTRLSEPHRQHSVGADRTDRTLEAILKSGMPVLQGVVEGIYPNQAVEVFGGGDRRSESRTVSFGGSTTTGCGRAD